MLIFVTSPVAVTGLQQELPPLPEGFYCSLPSSRIAHVTSPNGDVKLYVMSTSGDGLELDLASGNRKLSSYSNYG